MTMKYEVNEDLVAEVKIPPQIGTLFVNVIVSRIGDLHEVWLQGRGTEKFTLVATGTLEEMNAKRDRILRLVNDPCGPLVSGVSELSLMARNL